MTYENISWENQMWKAEFKINLDSNSSGAVDELFLEWH